MATANPFVPAVKEKVKLRMSLSGPSGSGKTYTALEMAVKLAELDNGKVAVIDTEGRSARRYADIFSFDVYDMEGNYNPQRLVNAIYAAGEHGYSVLVIDSLSHFWNGSGGVLEIVDKSQMGKNKMSGWVKGRPAQNALVDAIIHANVHIIATMRSKTEWVMEPDEHGKIQIRKAGVGVVQSNDLEYEFDIAIQLDQAHTLNISKSRCIPLNEQGDTFTDSNQIMETIHTWATDGETPSPRPQPKPQATEQRRASDNKVTQMPQTRSNGNSNGHTPEFIWTPYNIARLMNYWEGQGLTQADVLRLANITDKDDAEQWKQYTTKQSASVAIQTALNEEMSNLPPTTATKEKADDTPESTLPDNSPKELTCSYVRYFVNGQKYLEFSDNPQADDSTIIRGYGRSTNVKKWMGDVAYGENELDKYDGVEKTTDWRLMKKNIGITYTTMGQGDTAYNVMQGVCEADLPF